MYSKSVLAVSGAIFTLVAAIPMQHQHHQRDYVWVTSTEEAVVTIPVTQTVWIEPGETAPAAPDHEHSYGHGPSSSPVEASVTMASASSAPAPIQSTHVESSYIAPSSNSVYIASAPATTSVYGAPSSSPTSVYVAPTTSTSVYVAPTTQAPSSTWSAPAPPASSAASTDGSGLSDGMAAAGTKYTGDLTWYEDGLGACGFTNSSTEPIVAISHLIFDSYPDNDNSNKNPVCGKWVTITGSDGLSHQAQVVDRCTGCAEADLDLSEYFFNAVTGNGNGRVHNMAWSWN